MTTVIICSLVMTACLILRIVLYKPKLWWLKDILFFLILGRALSEFAPAGADVAASAIWTLITHLIANAIARRKNMDPKRHSSGRQPVRHGRTTEQPQPKRHGENPAQKWQQTPPPEPVTYAPPEPIPVPTPEPVPTPAPKPQVRQTLRACVRCGHKLVAPFCGECGYNHMGGEICLLRFVDPERLQISRKQ